ncbi:hypothetical protein MRX96_044334 [Rhipicephalus microplus]
MLTADDARLTADDARLTADNARLTTDNASVPGLVLSPVKQTVEGMTTPLVSEPSETPCEVPVVETVESQPEPLPAPSLAPEEPMEIIEDVPEDVPPREMEAKVESKEEVLEEDVDRTVSPAEGKLTSWNQIVLEPTLSSALSDRKAEDDLQEDPQLAAHEDEDDDAEESKDAWAPGTVSSPSPGEETMYDTRSEDDGDDKLKDDKSSIDDARTKTPETPSGTEPDMKDDASQHMESGTEDGSGDLSKHLLGSVGDSVPNSPASVLQGPMDLLTIKKNIENGCIRTTLEFQRDMMLMFQNAIMYNNSDHDVFHMAIEMRKEVMRHIQDFLATQLMVQTTETKILRGRDGRERKVEYSLDDKGKKRRKKLRLPAEEQVGKKTSHAC